MNASSIPEPTRQCALARDLNYSLHYAIVTLRPGGSCQISYPSPLIFPAVLPAEQAAEYVLLSLDASLLLAGIAFPQ